MKSLLYLFITVLSLNFSSAQNETTTMATTTTMAATTTTEQPDSNATTAPAQPTEPPTPTPERGFWEVSSNGVPCIMAYLQIRFQISEENKTFYYLLTPNATTNGSNCNAAGGTQLLKLNTEHIILKFRFFKDTFKRVYVQNINITRVFKENTVSHSENGTYFSVPAGNSYWCKSPLVYDIGPTKIEIFYIKMQGFATLPYFGIPEGCPEDDVVGNFVPIIVAIALICLIIIVLVAYVFGRRHSRKKGYTVY